MKISRSTVLCIDVMITNSLGQYGKVYKGLFKKRSAEIEVAIKTIKICGSDKENENFMKEMSVMSTLLHPNIIRFFGLTRQGETVSHCNVQLFIETCQTIDEPRIVLEYLPHGDLKSFLKVCIYHYVKIIVLCLSINNGRSAETI